MSTDVDAGVRPVSVPYIPPSPHPSPEDPAPAIPPLAIGLPPAGIGSIIDEGGIDQAAASSVPVHPQLKRIFLYLLVHASTLGILAISIPNLLLRIYDDDSSKSAYTSSWTAALTAGVGFFIYPVWGMLSDHYGRKPFILLSLFGSACAFLALGIFNNLASLIAAASIRGITDVSYTCSFAVLGDVTPKAHFIATYGKLQAASGVGIVIGPIIALLAELVEKHRFSFLLAGGIEVVNFLYVFWLFRETLFWFDREAILQAESDADRASLPRPVPIAQETFSQMYARRTLNPFKSLLILRTTPALWILALALFFNYVSFTGSISVFFLFTHERFSWGSKENGGYVLTLGCMAIISNALFLPKLMKVKSMTEQRLLVVSMLCSLGQSLIWAFIPSTLGWLLFLTCVCLSCSFFLSSLIRAMISRQIEPNKQGELQGGLTCLVSLASIIGPLGMNGVFGYFVSDDSPVYLPGAPFILSFFLNLLVASLLWYVCRVHLAHVSPHAYSISPSHEEARASGTGAIELQERMMTTGSAQSDDLRISSSAAIPATSPRIPSPTTKRDQEEARTPTSPRFRNEEQHEDYGELHDDEVVDS